ncbi:hypothetical protein HanXRQr2_Chr17g0793731 [Helianthus annuus]|uniref:Transposase (Putative), gypsy type n=1 Tax=Helianthus annuus TaxID=4232 RepID=A0A9K3DIT9_HELAN|nr:hypothetical protein HanXRQr2_Chr17g0793731 [Helianthus annuus]
MSGANPSSKKRRNKVKNPSGPDQAMIGWKEEEFQNLVREMGFSLQWGAQFPTPNSTALDAPPGYITLYAAFFREGNFRLPMTKFTAEVLTKYSLHISQINALGLPLLPISSLSAGLIVLNRCLRCSISNPPKSLHDWKQKFFYIRRGVIPVDMHYRAGSEGIPKVSMIAGFAQQAWYKKVTEKTTSISQLDELALVGAGMSLLWVPKNPFGVHVYGYQGKLGYSLLNVLDPKAGGAMVEAIQKDGKSTWLDQIRNRFLHPTSESFAAYGSTILGEDDEDEVDGTSDPTREEVIVLSSKGSDRSLEGLTPHSARAGPAQGAVNEPVNEPVDVEAEVPVETAEKLETPKKKRLDKLEGKEKRAEEKATETPRKRPSTLPFLDYIVISDTLSGLGTKEKRGGSDPDDSTTLTDMMRKKALEDKKRKLDEQAAAILASKKARLQKETPPAPSESEIDFGVFIATHGNLLEKIFKASGSGGVKPVKASRRFDISQITPPASPPSRTFGLSTPPEAPVEKEKQIPMEVEQVGEGGGGGGGGGGDAGGAGDVGGDGRGKGVETEAESSDATHRQTIYTRRHPAPGGGGTSGVPHGHEFEHVQAGSWDTHNPACDDLPHAPRWHLTQGSQMNDHANWQEFFNLSLPPTERLFQKRCNRFDLLDDHIHAGVNFFATSQEIVREWKLMGEETLEFENEKKAFAEEREKFTAEKKGLLWRVSDAEQKLAQEKQVNTQKKKDWETACERTNAEMQSQRDAIVKLSGEKKKISEEAEQARIASEKREEEYLQRIARLEEFGEKKVAECKASELLTEKISADCKWLLSRAVPLISERIVKSYELANYVFELGQAAYNSGQKEGYSEGRAAAAINEKDYHFELYKEDCSGKYAAKRREHEFVEFGIVKAVEKLSRKVDGVAFLKKALCEEGHGAGGAGPSQQD